MSPVSHILVTPEKISGNRESVGYSGRGVGVVFHLVWINQETRLSQAVLLLCAIRTKILGIR